MRLVERSHIDTLKWDELVNSSNADVFSFSWYLDALSEEWCVIVDDEYTAGMAIPYTKKLGVKMVYIPVFSRYTEWMGNREKLQETVKIIESAFRGYDLRISSQIGLQNEVELVYQQIEEQETSLGSQTKRMLNKAAKNEYKVEESLELDFALTMIENELSGKFKGVDEASIHRLKELCVSAARERMLRVFSIESIGAITCIQSESKLLYLKGTASEQGKKNGAMYALMKSAIDFAIANKLKFDFGGSNIEGVRKFNQNLGGTDVKHFGYSKNDAPFWYNLLRKIKHKGNY